MQTRRWLLPTLTALVLSGQTAKAGQPPGAAQATPEPAATIDPLGRDTQRGSVLGFLRASRNDKPETAVAYVEFPPKTSHSRAINLAEQLEKVLDEGLVNTNLINNRPEGRMEEGVPLARERAGTIHLRNGDVYDLTMVRVSAQDGHKIWLISREVVDLIPEMYKQVGFPEIESHLPAPLVRFSPGGVPLWKWIAAFVLFPIALVVAWLITKAVHAIRVYVRRKQGRTEVLHPWRLVLIPVLIMIGLIVHRLLIRQLGIPALYRFYYNSFVAIGLAICAAWILWRLIDRGTDFSRSVIVQRGYLSANAFVMLLQGLLKAVVIFLCFLILLSIFGVDTKAAMAGLGIGGIAIAFAAQKTLENLLGGVNLIFDQVLRVGDVCRLGDRTGTVEDISLRSTRLRTLEGSVLSIPNGSLSTINLENLSERRKILFNPTFTLRYETTADQLRKVLADIRALLYSHPQVEQGNCRARLGALAEYSVNIELFSYVLGGDFAAFTAIREDLLLRIFDIVREAGTDFAFPTQTVRLGKDVGLNQEKSKDAEDRVAEWRRQREVPFPDYAPENVERLRGSIPWPPPDSAVAPGKS